MRHSWTTTACPDLTLTMGVLVIYLESILHFGLDMLRAVDDALDCWGDD